MGVLNQEGGCGKIIIACNTCKEVKGLCGEIKGLLDEWEKI